MNSKESQKSVLALLDSREMAGVTFIRDYVQLLFDGPVLDAYTMPRIVISNKVFGPQTPGYRDALCAQIGKTVTATVEEPKEKLTLHFADGSIIQISLKEEDRVCVEAARFQDETGKHWNVW